MNNWSVYIILASDGSYYTGVSTDPERRFSEHLKGKKGARFFAGRRPEKIVYREDAHTRSSALRREYAIKQLTKAQKKRLATL